MFLDANGDEYGQENPLIMLGAGICKFPSKTSLAPLTRVADAVVVGSITLEPREGNTGKTEWFSNPLYSLNSIGMSNPGSVAVAKTKFPSDKTIGSLAEFSPEGYQELFLRLKERFAAVELNFGCPNTEKMIFSFSPDLVGETLRLIGDVYDGETIGVKLSPYTDYGLAKSIAKLIKDSGVVSYVATTNTIPGGIGFSVDGDNALDTQEMGSNGGIGGVALKPISLGNAAFFRKNLPDSIDVIRVGGITTGEDVRDSYAIGCKGVQVVTAAYSDTRSIERIRNEYAALSEKNAE